MYKLPVGSCIKRSWFSRSAPGGEMLWENFTTTKAVLYTIDELTEARKLSRQMAHTLLLMNSNLDIKYMVRVATWKFEYILFTPSQLIRLDIKLK